MAADDFPWWRCLHCGCDEYEDHMFTGHMNGVPMVHCVNCKALHSQPDPDSKRALRWQISELAEALTHIRNLVLCPVGPSPTIDELQEIASAALNAIAAGSRQGHDSEAWRGAKQARAARSASPNHSRTTP